MGKRRKSREIAIQILYQLEINKSDSIDALNTYWGNYHPADELKDFVSSILNGVLEHKKEIDRIIRASSDHWSLDRMPLVDRSILRFAIFEILFCSDIPVKVTLDEAIELAKKFSTEKSGAFINGILDKVAHQHSDIKPSLQT